MSWKSNPYTYRRRPTHPVSIGGVGVGGDHPIRVQSMTTPATTDTDATVGQILRLVEAGCEIVRVTVPTTRDADNLPNIRQVLSDRGVEVPLVADIHFTPAAAMRAVEHVEKIRINPGNYADRKRFAVREYTDSEYAAELERIETAFAPLVERCKDLGVAMRIGTNHGSLSDRIMNRFGDTPEGMVESALEFVRICERRGYHDLVLSMKASNPVVVLQAYRLLVDRMDRECRPYPLHLGVTEAGDGEDARVKSAVGIGGLLLEGIGDTVRVSLTEDPVAEIPVARALVAPFNRHGVDDEIGPTMTALSVAPGPRRPGVVAVEVPLACSPSDRAGIRDEIDAHVGPRVPEDTRPEVLSVTLQDDGEAAAATALAETLEAVAPGTTLSARTDRTDLVAALAAGCGRVHLVTDEAAAARAAVDACAERDAALLVESGDEVLSAAATRAAELGFARLHVAVSPDLEPSPLLATRRALARLAAEGHAPGVVLVDRPELRHGDPWLAAPAALGPLLCDGIGDAVHVETSSSERSRRLAFGILQAARVRITRTEFISCPSCGRTLFDLETTTARIKARTAHLKGVKIAIMGCVVNGPGEMADADFGYVGWGEDKIALFVGRDMVAKDIPAAEADDRLVALIREHGRWVDPPVSV